MSATRVRSSSARRSRASAARRSMVMVGARVRRVVAASVRSAAVMWSSGAPRPTRIVSNASSEMSPAVSAVETARSQGAPAGVVMWVPARTSTVASRAVVPVRCCTRIAGVRAPRRWARPSWPSSGRERRYTSAAMTAAVASTRRRNWASRRCRSSNSASENAAATVASSSRSTAGFIPQFSQHSNICASTRSSATGALWRRRGDSLIPVGASIGRWGGPHHPA